MYRLVDDKFKENAELYQLAVYCITETIKTHLEKFFHENYETESEQTLYTKVKTEEVLDLFPPQLLMEMKDMGIDFNDFIPKKMAQFMLLLQAPDDDTPDIFIEYILSKIIKKQWTLGFHFRTTHVESKKKELRRLLRLHGKSEPYPIEDVKELNQFVRETVKLLTDFSCLSGLNGWDDDSLAFWDWDFSFFDDWGFKKTIQEFSYGVAGHMRGYGVEYMQSIFTDVNERFPLVLIK